MLCASTTLQSSWAESQLIKFELQSEIMPDSSDDDKKAGSIVSDFSQGVCPEVILKKNPAEVESHVTGSDAYSSLTLHGPPAPNYPV